jgi:hypothetical protein
VATIHLKKANSVNTSVCGVVHPNVELTTDTSKSTCPQCMREIRAVVTERKRAWRNKKKEGK